MKWLLVAFFTCIASVAWAQNPTCPTRPPGDSTNACASTAFVGANGSVAPGLANQLGVYATSGTNISGLPTANNGVLVTSSGGVPSISNLLPPGVRLTGAIGPVIANSTGVLSSVGCVPIEAYGGKGDNSTDNLAAWNLAVAAFSGNFNCISFGPGIYKFSAAADYTLPNAISSFAIRGAGPDVTQLSWPNATNGIELVLPNIANTFNIHSIGITTGQASNTTIGLKITRTAPGGASYTDNNIDDVSLHGADGYVQTDYWGIGIKLIGAGSINFIGDSFNGLFIGGGYVTVGVGIDLEPNGIILPVGFVFNNCQFNNLGTGIQYGTTAQGISVINCNFTGGNVGIFVPAGETALAELLVVGSQFNDGSYAIFTATNVPNTIIVGNDIYVPSTAVGGVILSDAYNFSIVGNHFNPTSGSPGAVGFQVGTDSQGGVVTGNFFDHMTIAIILGAGSLNVNVQSNAYNSNVGTKVSNAGTGNTLGGGSL
jgi:hypothetical protein